MHKVRGIFILVLGTVLLSLPFQVRGDGHNNGWRMVSCDRGETIGAALEKAKPGDTIRISGTCVETVVITLDDLTLAGAEGAVIDGGGGSENVVTIDGARNLMLTGLTVQNGREGILAVNGALFTATDVTVQDNASHGIELIRASADFGNVTSRRNVRAGLITARNSSIDVTDVTLVQNLTGLVIYSNSSVRLFGRNLLSQNATQGWTVGLGGAAFSIGSQIEASDNGAEGLFVLQSGKVQLVGGALDASRNGTNGITLNKNATILMGIEEFGVPGAVITADNAGHGVSVGTGSDAAGIALMPLTSRGNGEAGLRLDDGGSATLAGAIVAGNGTADVSLTFGARATLEGNTIGAITCDSTALLRGVATTCPTP